MDRYGRGAIALDKPTMLMMRIDLCLVFPSSGDWRAPFSCNNNYATRKIVEGYLRDGPLEPPIKIK